MAPLGIEHARVFAQPLALWFAERILNSLGQGLALAGFAWILLCALPRPSSSTRFAVWFSALLTLAALPFVPGPAMPHALSASNPAASAFRLPASWAVRIFIVWALLASFGLLRIALSFFRLHRLRQTCQPIHLPCLSPTLQVALQSSNSVRRIALIASPAVRVPAAIGFLHPAIVIPQWALRELDAQELNSVLLHELAHLRRWDDWTNLAQQVLRALFFFHPAVWWIGRSLALEREMACDDFALASAPDPAAYARCLVSVAEKSFLRRRLALALAMAGRIHQTARRLARILDATRPTSSRVCPPALSLAATLPLLCLLLLPRLPRLVAFDAASSVRLDPATTAPSLSSDEFSVDPAQAIPATFHPRVQTAAHLKPATHFDRQVSIRPKAATANFIPHPAHRQKLLNVTQRASSQNFSSQTSARPQSVFVVLQTQQLDDSGSLLWSVQIFRLTLLRPLPSQTRPLIAPKST